MNNIKQFFSNIGYKIKNFFYRVAVNSYGLDDLNKTLFGISFGLSILQLFVRNYVIYILQMITWILFMFRFFSKKKYARSEENRKFRRFFKYYKLKLANRKTHKVFKCSKCGQFIRVPKGQGKIETTCPSCSNVDVHRT